MGQNPAAKYAPEFRRETADCVIASGRPIAECCRELGPNPKTVNGWVIKSRRETGGEGASGSDAEPRAAKKRIGELEMENGFPRKAAAFFARTQGSGAPPPDGGGEGRVRDGNDGEAARRGPLGLLRPARARPGRPVGVRARRGHGLLGVVRGRLGARAVRARPAAQGAPPALYRVRKIMRGLGIRGAAPNARKVTTVPDPGAPSRPDLVRRRFRPPVPTTVLAGDITYLRTGQGRLHPAAVIDPATPMVVGWSMSERMTARLAVSALEMAHARGYVAGGAISRSDRGPQHASQALAGWAAARDVRLSVGRTGSCRDNAVAESFFATLKNETCSLRSWATKAEARHARVEFIEGYCNRRRPHPTIGYQIPAERMEAFMERMEAAFAGDGGKVPLAA